MYQVNSPLVFFFRKAWCRDWGWPLVWLLSTCFWQFSPEKALKSCLSNWRKRCKKIPERCGGSEIDPSCILIPVPQGRFAMAGPVRGMSHREVQLLRIRKWFTLYHRQSIIFKRRNQTMAGGAKSPPLPFSHESWIHALQSKWQACRVTYFAAM